MQPLRARSPGSKRRRLHDYISAPTASVMRGSLPSWSCFQRSVDRYYLLLAALVALTVLVLNRAASGQGGITPYFQDLANVIRAGFDPAAATRRGAPTYPMWGYAWLFLVTENHFVLVLVQNAAALLAAGWLVRTLATRSLFGPGQLTLLRLLLIVSLPWYAFHSVPWEASLQATLLLVGCTFAIRYAVAANTGGGAGSRRRGRGVWSRRELPRRHVPAATVHGAVPAVRTSPVATFDRPSTSVSERRLRIAGALGAVHTGNHRTSAPDLNKRRARLHDRIRSGEGQPLAYYVER